jgi:hypothetical protein
VNMSAGRRGPSRQKESTSAKRTRSEQIFLLVPAALAVWLGAAAAFFHAYHDWSWPTSLYYAIDTGLSIGFGALQPKDDFERVVVATNVLIGAGAVSAALALFTESLLTAGRAITAEELADKLNKDLTQMSSTTLLRELTVAQQQSAAQAASSNPLQTFLDDYIRSNTSWEEELLVVYLLASSLSLSLSVSLSRARSRSRSRSLSLSLPLARARALSLSLSLSLYLSLALALSRALSLFARLLAHASASSLRVPSYKSAGYVCSPPPRISATCHTCT